ncbi:hypothetical protein [Microbacterium sp. PA5]|uniref:hypothetical protein n=1 Tax=Microbacterium sp. PA5 TaxID=3416654 RepID=UPI003CED8550
MIARVPSRLALTVLLAAGIAVAASACAPSPAPAPTMPGDGGTTETVAPVDPSASPGPEETGNAVDPATVTCENLIGPDLVTELTDQGWTARKDPFVIGDTELPDGTACTWGDFDNTTGDDLLLFGWSPITAEEAATVQTSLEAEGWIAEDGSEGLYVTEDPAQAIAVDEDGYGMTYLFGDGWVMVSDTKQGLILIERPGA